MSDPDLMPVLFVGHGSPVNAVEDNEFSRGWREVAGFFRRPAAILCVSAHWETAGVRVQALPNPKTIHDFWGFPEELYAVRYPAPGSRELTDRVLALLGQMGVAPDREWGLDHGAWSVLRRMYPEADIPVVQLSLDSSRPGEFHYRVGEALRPLREKDVLVLGSGNQVHNLRLFDYDNPTPYPWAAAFDAKIAKLIAEGRHDELAAYRRLGREADLSIPTAEHYLPLLYVLALRREGEEPHFFNRKVVGSISMTSVAFGL